MAKQIINDIIHSKSNKLAIVGTREEFKGKDLVNLREFIDKNDELTATEKGFTIPSEQFREFFNALRKFGRTAGLLPDKNEDPKAFVLQPLPEKEGDDADTEEEEEEEEDGDAEEAKPKKSGIKRTKKEKKADKKKNKEVKEKVQKKLKGTKEKSAKAPKVSDEFSMKEFKKAIKLAFKHADDMSHAADVLAIYKAHRKQLKDELPKHAVNACEKALENKKDDNFLAKAIVSLVKHVLDA